MSVGMAEEVCQPVNATPIDPAMQKLVNEMTGACTLQDVKNKKTGLTRQDLWYANEYWAGVKEKRIEIDMGIYEEINSEELCSCLQENKRFNEIRVPENKKELFSKQQLDNSVSNTLKIAMNDLYSNITKFKNLNLPKSDSNSLHYKSMSLCSPEVLAQEIASLKDSCPGGRSSFDTKVKEIFGADAPSDIPLKIIKSAITFDSNSCLSKHQYLHLRSSNLHAEIALGFFQNQKYKHLVTNGHDQTKIKDLVSYDLFFNLGYRDEKFRKDFGSMMDTLGTDNTAEIYDDIYNEPKALQLAMTSLEEGCREFKANVTTFLCMEDAPKMNSLPLSLLVNDFVNGEQTDPVTAQSMRDHYVNKLSCGKGARKLNPDEQKLNDYIQSTKLTQLNTFNPVGEGKTEYKDFNDTFCGNRTLAAAQDLPAMMKDFFDSKKAAGIDLNAFFTNTENMNQIGLKINTNENPPISIGPNVPVDRVPEISPYGWKELNARLLATGLSQNEINQLYSIIEMQTNSRARAVIELREEFTKKYPDVPQMSPADLDGLLRGSPEVVSKLSMTNPQAMYAKDDIDRLFEAQKSARQDRIDGVSNSAPSTNVSPTVATSTDTPAETPTPVTTPTAQAGSTESEAENVTTWKKTPSGLTVTSTTQDSRGTRGSTNGSQSSSGSISNSGSSAFNGSRSIASSGSNSATDDSSSSNTTRTSQTGRNSRNSEMDSEIKRIEDEIRRSRERFNRTSKTINDLNSTVNSNATSGTRRNRAATSFNNGYNYPKNVPFKSKDGDYYYPETQGSELSSAADTVNGKKSDKSSRLGGGGAGSSAAPGASTGISSLSMGGGGALSGGGRSGPNRDPASVISEAQAREDLKLAPYEHYKYIPHSIFDIVGSIDKVVLLLGLEGKSFKTIEAIEEYDESTEKVTVKYIERTFDFLPEGKFEEFRTRFATKKARIETFENFFTYPRNKENLKISKNYSLATKEISKKEVPHSFVMKIENYILSDAEIRATMKVAMENLK